MKPLPFVRTAYRMLIFPLSQLCLLLLYVLYPRQHSAVSWPLFFLLSVGCVLADAGLWFAFRSIRKSAREAARVEELEQRIAVQKDYYEKTARQYEQLRHLRHDCANHCYTLRILMQSGQQEKALRYAESLKEDILRS